MADVPGTARVVVIGGGSVAFDAARTAVREFYEPMEEIEATAEAAATQPLFDAARGALRSGASEVHVASLESLEEMPAALTVQGRDELREAIEIDQEESETGTVTVGEREGLLQAVMAESAVG